MKRTTWTKRLLLLAVMLGMGLSLSGCSMLGRKQSTYSEYHPPSSYDYNGKYEGGNHW